MSNENTANLPHDVQEAIKAAKEKAEKEKAKGVRQDVQGAVDKVLAERAAKKEKETYVVQSGDSLSKIAKELLGDAARWPEIYELNKDQIENPDLIYPGQELRLP